MTNEFPYRVAAAIDASTKEWLCSEARKRGVTQSTLVRDLLVMCRGFFSHREGNRVTGDTAEKQHD